MCKVSVLMSVYNESEKEINEAIASVLNQSYTDFEFIIVNDNPNNRAYDQLFDRISDNRIIVLKNKYNIGLALSMNKAAKQAKGKYFARMDADDVCLPLRFEKQVSILENKNADIVSTNYTTIDAFSNFINAGKPSITGIPGGGRITPVQIVFQAMIHHPTVMMTREIFEAIKGYNPYPCAQDHDLWLRMLEAGGRFHLIDEILLYYRVREAGVSKKAAIAQHLTIYYSSQLFIRRLKGKEGSFCEDSYQSLLQQYNSERINKNYNKARKLLTAHANNRIKKFIFRIRAFIICPIYRKTYLQKVSYTKLVKDKFS